MVQKGQRVSVTKSDYSHRSSQVGFIISFIYQKLCCVHVDFIIFIVYCIFTLFGLALHLHCHSDSVTGVNTTH